MARQPSQSRSSADTVRIDKWLWAARFYKTRALASEAIKNGKVIIDGVKIRPGKNAQPGVQIDIRQGHITRSIIIRALSSRRGPACQAILLYDETDESIARREQQRITRKAQPAMRDAGMGRPTKRERRHIISFTDKNR